MPLKQSDIERDLRYAGWNAAPGIKRMHTIFVSAYCTLMLSAAGTAAAGIREIIAAGLIAFK